MTRRKALYLLGMLALLGLLVAAPARAQGAPPGVVTLHFSADQPNTWVKLRTSPGGPERLLGRTGQPIRIDLSKYPPHQTFYFILHHRPKPHRPQRFLDTVVPLHPAQMRMQRNYPKQLYLKRIAVHFVGLWPPDATVYRKAAEADPKSPGVLLGKAYDPATGQYLVVDRTDVNAALHLVFRRKGYDDAQRTIPYASVLGNSPAVNIYKLNPPISLPGKSGLFNMLTRFWVWARFEPAYSISLAVVVGGGLALIPLWWWPRRHAELARLSRERRLSGFESKVTDEDPNLLKVLGDYRLVDRLGAGGMAVVYRAVPDETLDESEAVAIKVMNADLAGDPEYRRRFDREVDVSRELDHRNIVHLITWGEQEGVLYLVMELVDGHILREEMPSGGMALETFRGYFRGMCEGLAHAHAKGIVHRDLKPANIMVTPKGRLKIMDLGLAKGNRPGHDVTRTGDALGTPAYMPPEQITGGMLTPRSDQYALGVMAFEMLTGRLPFREADDAMAVLLKHLQEEPPGVREFRPQLPEGIEVAIRRMLQKDPGQRFDNITQVLEAFEQAFAGASEAADTQAV